jgi:hypothetical protein
MNKRDFLQTAALGLGTVTSFNALAQNAPKAATGPVLLTVSGLIGPGNRGPLDPALDQMMHKQKVSFSKAHAFDFAALTALPAITIKPTLEYDNKPHVLKGPLLTDVLKVCCVKVSEKTALLLRAVDGYGVLLTAAEATQRRFILATHIDNRPMGLGGLGPLWAVYDADRFPDMAAKPVNQRFSLCPWATYHIEVRES